MNQEFMKIQLNQHRCRKKTFQSPRDTTVVKLKKKHNTIDSLNQTKLV